MASASDGMAPGHSPHHLCLDGDAEHPAENVDDGSMPAALAGTSHRPPIVTDGAACISYSLQAFDEKDAAWVFEKINRIPEDSSTEYSIEDSEERTKVVLDRYQEQPHLLDPCLPQMFALLTKYFVAGTGQSPDAIVNDAVSRKRAVLAAKYMVLIAKVRGYKVIIRYLPHEVKDLPRVLFLLQQPALVDRNWEVCYLLLLWLSIAAQVPFKLALLDAATGKTADSLQTDSVQQMFDISKRYIVRPQCDKRQDAAAFLLAKLLARPDTQSNYLKPTIQWLLDRIDVTSTTEVDDKSAAIGNALLALAMIFKYCARDALLPHASTILDRLISSNLLDTSTASAEDNGTVLETEVDGNVTVGGRSHRMRVRKLYMKAVQRIGLSLLRTRSHAWKYQQQPTRPGKVLMGGVKQQKTSDSTTNIGIEKLSSNAGDSPGTGISNVVQRPVNGTNPEDASSTHASEVEKSTTADNGDFDADADLIHPSTELVVGELLRGLRDRDTIVRWPAAKGIGRIADRLPSAVSSAAEENSSSYCSDIIDSVLEIFQTYDADGTWHGACLALAEMARRGCVPPTALDAILPNVERALLYDCPRGSYSVGQQVRDAACYVYWAFARAFSPNDMSHTIIPRLRASLLIVALFDREVNCRRAAAAAIQESIGRQGLALWPHGIGLIQLVDFEGVGRLSNTYLRLAPQICMLLSSDHATGASSMPSMAQIFIDHLISYKAVHTERTLRDLASKSVALSAPYCLKGTSEQRRDGISFLLQLLSELLERCLTSSLTGATHGLLLSVGNLFFSVCQCLISKADDLGPVFGPKFTQSAQWKQISHAAVDLVMHRIPESRILHGVGQEMLREAVLHFMACLIKAQLLAPVEVLCVESSNGQISSVTNGNGSGEPIAEQISRTKLMQTLWLAIRECLETRSERVQFLAIKCLRDYCMLLLYDHEKSAASGEADHYAEGDAPKFVGLANKKLDIRSIIRNSSSFDDILSAAAADPTSFKHLTGNTNGFDTMNENFHAVDRRRCMPESMQLIVDYCFNSITGSLATNSPQTASLTPKPHADSVYVPPSALISKHFVAPSETHRRGGIGALTALPTPVTLLSYCSPTSPEDAAHRIVLSHAIDICIESTRQDVWYDCRWLECRAQACSTLTELLLNAMTLFEEHAADDDSSENRKILISELNYAVSRVFEFLATNLNDYTRESSRGDIGRVVRERALECLDRLLGKLAHFGDFERRNLLMSAAESAEGEKSSLRTSIQRIVGVTIRLACENIDKTRNKAVALLLTVCGFLNSHTKNLSVNDDDHDDDDEIESDDEKTENLFDADRNNSHFLSRSNTFYADFVADFDLIVDTMRSLIAEAIAADVETGNAAEHSQKTVVSPRIDMIAAGTLFSVHQIFHAMCQLLPSQHYSQYVIDGLTLSVGSLTRSLVTDGIACMENWINAQQKSSKIEHLTRFMQCLEVLASYAAQSAVVPSKTHLSAYDTMFPMPILRFFSTSLEYGVLPKVLAQNPTDIQYLLAIFEHLKLAAATSKAMHKVLLWISICSGCLQFDFSNESNSNNSEAIKLLNDLRQRALNRLLILLGHTYPRIRFQAAQQLQEALLLEPELLQRLVNKHSIADEQNQDEIEARIMAILDETDWNGVDRSKSTRARDELTKLFGVKSIASPSKKQNDGQE